MSRKRVRFQEQPEYYDPNSDVCSNQSDFNMAFKNAIKYTNDENMKKARPWLYVYLGLWTVFFVWAILLAMKVQAGPERVEHLVFAIVFSPVYVIAYYLGMIGGQSGMGWR